MDELNQINKEREIAQEFKIMKDFLCFNPDFMELYREEVEKLPKHINLIDVMGADENTHSRILACLLRQKTSSGQFAIMESFVQYIKVKVKKKSDVSDFKKIKVNNPIITHGTKFIDLWIRDYYNYAIIIENKIHRKA